MTSNIMKNPPCFEDENSYEKWRKDIEIWVKLTDLKENKQALAIHLSLTGKAREISSEISVDVLSQDDGVSQLTKKLDEVFLLDKEKRAFMAYQEFERFKRPSDMTIGDYISSFERLYFKFSQYDMKLPDAVLAYRLLESCNLADIHFQLAMTTINKITFGNMKDTLRRIFSGGVVNSVNTNSTEDKIKIEPQDVFHGKVQYNSEIQNRTLQEYKNEDSEASQYYTSSRNLRRGYYGNYRNNRRGNRNFRFFNKYGSASTSCLNPKDQNGFVTKCFRCQSMYHYSSQCPENTEQNEKYVNQEVHLTLFSNAEEHITLFAEDDDRRNKLTYETLGSVVLDSGCTATVCGEIWLESYIDALTDKEKLQIEYEDSETSFKFGDGDTVRSKGKAVVPCVLAGRNVNIRTDVVDCNIPLLLSRSAMKRAGIVIDFSGDTATLFGRNYKLNITSTGHYSIPIIKCNYKDISVILYTGNENEGNDRVALKLHKQFAHPSAERLIKLVRDAGINDRYLIDEIKKCSENCQVCIRLKKPKPRPVVGFPLATKFNETVAIDLKFYRDVYFLVLIDIATRYCQSVVVTNKKPETILSGIFKCWIRIFGPMRTIFSDNGGEFSNEILRNMAENFNITVKCTAAESPWSNGTCERLNAVLGDNVQKILDDTSCDIYTALSWAVAARNALQNNHGFSPNQLVFGYNPVLPNVYINKLPALERKVESKIVADNLNALHSAREAFLKNESNERLRRALLHNVRSAETDILDNGSWVYYKRQGEKRWRGPGVVIGRDGKQILVKHGGIYIRAHECRLQSAKLNDGNVEKKNVSEEMDSETDIKAGSPVVNQDIEEYDNVENREDDPTMPVHEGRCETETVNKFPTRNIRNGMRIEGTLVDSGAKVVLKILGRAGKVTGKYKNCFNFENETDGSKGWMDIEKDINNWKEIMEDEEILITYDNDLVTQAKENEIKNWHDNEVYEEVDYNCQTTISVRWVITEKQKENKKIIKARLVARGYEEDTDGISTDSPTCSKEALRISLAVMASKKWKCHTIDVKSAFLQGFPIEREVFLQPPPEYDNGKVWKLKKTVYGLNDAAKAWYTRVKQEILNLGVAISPVDPAFAYWHNNGVLEGIVCIHVDDFLFGGTVHFKNSIIDKLSSLFLIGSSEEGSFKYLGLNINQDDSMNVYVDQDTYINSIKPIDISAKRKSHKDQDLSDKEKTKFRALIGQLNWVATQTRPDVSFDVCELSLSVKGAKVEDMIKANKILSKVQSEKVSICYPSLELGNVCLKVYSDASFANMPGDASQEGYIIFLVSDKEYCPIYWKSTKIRKVVKSTLASETFALVEAAEAGIYIAHMLRNILSVCSTESKIPVYMYTDNKSLLDAINSSKQVADKSLRIHISVVKDMLKDKSLTGISWIDSSQQIADCLTKRGASCRMLMTTIQQ